MIERQKRDDCDVVTGTRYVRHGGVHGWCVPPSHCISSVFRARRRVNQGQSSWAAALSS